MSSEAYQASGLTYRQASGPNAAQGVFYLTLILNIIVFVVLLVVRGASYLAFPTVRPQPCTFFFVTGSAIMADRSKALEFVTCAMGPLCHYKALACPMDSENCSLYFPWHNQDLTKYEFHDEISSGRGDGVVCDVDRSGPSANLGCRYTELHAE